MPLRAVVCTSLAALACVGAGSALAASGDKPVVAGEKAGGAAAGAPDLTRVSLQRSSDGRLRAGLTFASELEPKAFVAKSGPPGSACLRVYTNSTPGALPPDYLVCITSDAKGKAFRGTITAEQVNALPKKVGTAIVSRPSKRSVVLRFSQSSVGKPPVIRFLAEATREGCIRASCVDTLPNAPETKQLTLRAAEAPAGR